MIDIADKAYKPCLEEISAFVGIGAFDALRLHMEETHHALIQIAYSGDAVLLGWNVKYKKAGRTLCTVYPRAGRFHVLLVVGRREKERVERLLPALSEKFRALYASTREGMGQRWLLLDIAADGALLADVYAIARIRRESA